MSYAGLRWHGVALLLGSLLLVALHYYPATGGTVPLILGLSGFLLYRHPLLICVLLPAGMASFDLAPITGWYFLEEIDLLLMLAAAVCYARLASCPDDAPALGTTARFACALLTVVMLYGLFRSTHDTHELDFMSMNDYLSPYMGIRSVKAWLWMVVYLPLLRKLLTQQPMLIDRYLLPGMLAGLWLVSISASYERWQFPGLLNLSSDYRITAPFSAMHTGGAALDGYLGMSLPLLAVWLARPTRSIPAYCALFLLPLALYAALATFSRGLYLGLSVAGILLLATRTTGFALTTRQTGARTPMLGSQQNGRIAVALLILLIQLELSFVISGYRGMLAVAGVLMIASLPSSAPSQKGFSVRFAAGMALLGALALFAPRTETEGYLFKLPYLAFLFSAGGYFLAISLRSMSAPILLGTLLGSSLWISVHYAGAAALPYSSLQVATCLLLRWLLRRKQLDRSDNSYVPPGWLIAATLASAIVIPFSNGYFVGERFATVGEDLRGRWQHWRDVLQIMQTQPDSSWTGVGPGRFPAMYYWFNARGERPAHARFVKTHDAAYLQLDAGSYPQGYGELLRVLQVLPLKPATPYQFSIMVAGGVTGGFLQIRVCARQLLYATACTVLPQQSIAPLEAWRTLHFSFISATLDSAKLPVQLELAAEGDRTVLNIDNVSLIELPTGRELIRNGSFDARHTDWFFSSDHHHLPWHIKNLLLNFYFELGLLGLSAYLLLLGSAVASLLKRASIPTLRHSSLVWLSALVAFELVGLFDSLIDVPRILFLHLFILFAAILSRPSGDIRHYEHSTI